MEPRKSILKNYELITTNGIPCNLGFGAYGAVQLGKCLKTGRTVAVKKISRKLAVNEVQVHKKLNHPNIIQMYDYQFDQKAQTTFIVLQYAENGTLFDYIKENGLKDKQMIRGIFHSICDAIQFMHSNNIMHRDIKPQNILLDHKNMVKVCDFGFATNMEPRMTLCGTVQYMAPEMILRKPYTHKIDIWGLGILLFQLIQGHAPFEGTTQEQILMKMKDPIYFSKNFTTQQVQLIHKILKVNPNQRPQISEITKSSCLHTSKSTATLQYSKRSTAEESQRQEKCPKKIQIIEVKDLKKKSNIQITSIKQISHLNESQNLSSFLLGKSDKEKISLKKTRKS